MLPSAAVAEIRDELLVRVAAGEEPSLSVGDATTEPEIETGDTPSSSPLSADRLKDLTSIKGPVKDTSDRNLANFITAAVLEGGQVRDDGTYVTWAGAENTAKLTFAERDGLQFANEGELTYRFPSCFALATDQPAAHDPLVVSFVGEDGERIPLELGKDCWWVEGSTLHLKWAVRDADERSADDVAQALRTIYDLTTVQFDLDVVGAFAEGATSVDFGAATGPISLSVEPAPADGEQANGEADRAATSIDTDEPVIDSGSATTRAKAARKASLTANGDFDLTDFLTGVDIVTSSGQGDKDYTLMSGESYLVKLTFEENGDKQFLDDNGNMTYTLPSDFTVSQAAGNFSIRVTDTDGTVYIVKDNDYRIDGNKLIVNLNKDDPNFSKLTASGNARFTVSFEAKYEGEGKDLVFNDRISKTVYLDETSEVNTQKYATVDLANKKVTYNVTVYSTGHSTGVVVRDTLTSDHNVLALKEGSFAATSSVSGTMNPQPNVSDNSFSWNIGDMKNGEVITLTYEADIDTSKLTYTADNVPQVEQAHNTVAVHNDKNPTDRYAEVTTTIDYSPKIAKDGMVLNEDGSKFSCRYTFNQDMLVNGGKRTITDTLGEYLKFDNDAKVTVKVYKSGSPNPVRTETYQRGGTSSGPGSVTWTDDNSFTYTTANDSENFKYVVEYEATITGTEGINTQTTTKNTVSVDGGGTSTGTGVITPADENSLKLYKTADDIDYEHRIVTWTTTISVPKNGLTGATSLVDTLPGGSWYNGSQLYDTLVKADNLDNSVTVTGLKQGDSYTVSTDDANHTFTVNFYRNNDTDTPGLSGSDASYIVTVTYQTHVNEDWFNLAKTESWREGHTNTATLKGTTATATAYVVGEGITKTFKQAGTRTVGDVELPVYKYELELRNVTQADNVIEDTFDTSILTPFFPSEEDNWTDDDKQYFSWHTTNATYNGRSSAPVTCINTATGMRLVTNADSMVTDDTSTTGFYPITKIVYYLTVKDETALKKLQSLAIASDDGTKSLTNTASWGEDTSNVTVVYQYPGIKKTLNTPTSDLSKEDEEITTEFKIDINPGAQQLNGGAPMTAVDKLHNLSVDITSIQISPPNTGITYDMEGNTLTFQNIPDATHVVITYSARVTYERVGNPGETVRIDFSNDVSMNGYSDTVHNVAQHKDNGEGAAEIYSVKLMKYRAGDMSQKLAGATFALFQAKADSTSEIGYVPDESNPVVDKNGNPVTFTTGNDGLIEVKGDQAADGWTIQAGQYYFLRETAAPEGYKLSSFDYAFMVSADGTTNYGKYIYHSGDTMSAKNYPGTDVHVQKAWGNDYVAPAGTTVTVKLQQKVEGGEWSDTIRLQEDDGTWSTYQSAHANEPWTLVLSDSNDWQGVFKGLPLYVDELNADGTEKSVEHRIIETAVTINGVEESVSVNGDDLLPGGGNGKFQWTSTSMENKNGTVITNMPVLGAINLQKLVTLNGSTTEDMRLNGDYEFTIKGKPGTSTENSQATVTVTIQDGKAQSAEVKAIVNGKEKSQSIEPDADGSITIYGLGVGEYTLQETDPKTGVRLVDATGGTGTTDGVVSVKVEGGQTAVEGAKATFTNDLGYGSLKLTKKVLENGEETTGNGANGDYTFTVVGPTDVATDSANYVNKTIVLTVRGGKVVSGKEVSGSGNVAVQTFTPDSDGYVELTDLVAGEELTDLVAGDYIVSELTPTNDAEFKESTITPAEGTTSTDSGTNGNSTRGVTVAENKTADAAPKASFTNNIEVGSLKIHKRVTVNGTDAKDTGAFGTKGKLNGTYTFQIRKGTNDTTTNPLIRVELTFEDGQIAYDASNSRYKARYEIYDERVPFTKTDGTTGNHLKWYDLVPIDTDGTVQIDGLTPGQYVIHEVENKLPDGVYLVGGNAQGGNDQEVTVVANNTTDIPTASFTNNKDEYGELTLSKEVVSHSPALTDAAQFNFTVTMYKDARRTEVATDINGNYGDLVFNAGVATVRLAGGETKKASLLPTGLYYTVTESAMAGWTLEDQQTGEPRVGIITTTASAETFTNHLDEGTLEVHKTVESTFANDANKPFTFTVTLTGVTLTGTYGDMTFSNGVATFQLKHGEKKTATGLPAGIAYRVEERAEDGFSTTWEGQTGTVAKDATASARATNTRQYGDLELQKVVVSNIATDQSRSFTFTVTLSDKTINGTYGDGSNVPMIFSNGVATVSITGSTKAVAHNLPAGVTYTITEASVDGFALTGVTASTGTITTAGAKASFTNARDNGGLRITKSLVSATTSDKDRYFPFKVTLYTDAARNVVATGFQGTHDDMTFVNGVAYVFLKDQMAAEATGIDTGLYFRVEELDISNSAMLAEVRNNLPSNLRLSQIASLDQYATRVNDSLLTGKVYTGQISTATSVGRYTNTHQTGELTVAKAVVSDAAADKNVEFTFHVTVYTDASRTAKDTSIDGTFGAMRFTQGEAEVKVKGDASVTATGLPVGLYYKVTEENVPGFTRTGITVNSGPKITTASQGTGVISTSKSTVQIENTRATGKLRVQKSLVSDAAADKDKSFTFTVKLSDTTISKTYSGVEFVNGVGTFTLKGGQTKEIAGLPTGVGYQVSEEAAAGFTRTGTTAADAGTISTTPAEVTFTNTRDKGRLTVAKTLVSDAAADKKQEFRYTVTLYKSYTSASANEVDTSIDGKTYGGVTFTKGVGTFTLKGGESKDIDGLPVGIVYAVTEESAPGFTLTGVTGTGTDLTNGGVTTGKTGAISSTVSTATFTNTRDKGRLTLSKKLVSALNADKDQTFTFVVKLSDTTINKTYGDVKFTSGEATVTLKGDQSKTVEGLPQGISYTVTEQAKEGLSLTGTAGSGTQLTDDSGKPVGRTGRISATDAQAELTNSRDKGGFSFSKAMVGTALDESQEFVFTVTVAGAALTAGEGYGTYSTDGSSTPQSITFAANGTATVRLRNGGYAKVENLPLGASYTVSEAQAAGFTASTGAADAQGRFGAGQTAADGSTYVEGVVSAADGSEPHGYAGPAFTNTHDEGALSLQKTVVSDYAPDKDVAYAFRVELSDKSVSSVEAAGDAAYKAGTYAVVESGDHIIPFMNGVATLSLKHGETASIKGLPAGVTYTVTETTVSGMSTTWYDTVTTDGSASKYVGARGTGTIVKDQTATTTATNKRQYGKLNVNKTVVSHTADDLDHEFAFTASFYTDETRTAAADDSLKGIYRIDGGEAKSFTGNSVSFNLKGGQTASFENLPLGLYYQVSETRLEGAYAGMVTTTGKGKVTDGSGNPLDYGQVTSAASSSFTNSRTEGGLYVYKNVDSHLAADKSEEFPFTVTLYTDEGMTRPATNINGTYGTGAQAMTFTGGVAQFKLKDGAFAYAMNLPVGLYFKVMEDNSADFNITVGTDEVSEGDVQPSAGICDIAQDDDPSTDDVDESSPARTGVSWQVSNGNRNVYFTNTRKTGELTVKKKEPAASDTDVNTDFSFIVELGDTSINGTFGDMTFVNGVANFTLKKGQSLTARDLPAGTRYRVTEVNAGNYIINWKQTTYANDSAHAAAEEKQPTAYEYRINQNWERATSDGQTTYSPQSETKIITWSSGPDTKTRTFTNGSFGYSATDLGELVSWAKENASTEWAWRADGEGSELQIAALTEGKTDEVVFTNKLETGTLQLYKTTHSALTADRSMTFHYSVRFLDSVADGTYGQMYVENGVAYSLDSSGGRGVEGFDIASGDVIEATGLPKGVRYLITETSDAEFDGKATNTSGRVGYYLGTATVDGQTVQVDYELINDQVRDDKAVDARVRGGYDNFRKTGQLKVYKTVDSPVDADKKATYTFQVELPDAADYATPFYALTSGAEGSYEIDTSKEVVFSGGKATFTLADATSVYFYNGDPNVASDFSLEEGQTVYVPCTDAGGTPQIAADLGLPIHQAYKVTETVSNGLQATWTGDTGTIDTAASVARCTNERDKGTLSISKEVVSEAAADKTRTFNFTVALYEDADLTTPVKINDRYGDMLFDDGVAPVVLMSGQTATATGLPAGIYYTVTEQDTEGFVLTAITAADAATVSDYVQSKESDGVTVSWRGKSGSLEADKDPKLAFTNTRVLGRLGVLKTVESAATADKDQEFTFTVLLSDNSIDKTYETTSHKQNAADPSVRDTDKPIEFHNGMAVVKLKHGEQATAEGLPTGIAYTVTEENATGYTTTTDGVTSRDLSTVAANAETLSVTNTRSLGGIQVEKAFSNTEPPADKDFSFTVTLYKDAARTQPETTISGQYGDLDFNEGVATTTLSKTNNWSASTGLKLPTSLYYEVIENMTDDQLVDYRLESTVGEVGAIASPVAKATFTNERIYRGDLLVKKVITTPVDQDADLEFDLTVTLYTDHTHQTVATDVDGPYSPVNEEDAPLVFDHGIAHITLKAGQQASAASLPIGYGYTVEETLPNELRAFSPQYTTYVGDQIVTDPEDQVINQELLSTVEVENKRDLTALSIRKEWNTAGIHSAADLPDAITVNLMRSDDTDHPYKTLSLSADNGWSALLENLPATDYEGNAYTYTWDEPEVEGWALTGKTEASGVTTLTNTYVERPDFEKKVMDTNDSTGEESGWQDSADYDIGDEVPYRLTATLPGNASAYEKYHLTFADRMEDTLDFNKGSVDVRVVSAQGEELDTDSYDVTLTDEGAHGFSLRIDWGDEHGTSDRAVLDGARVEVYFTATLNATAHLGKTGNVNACKLAYSNNPADRTGEEEAELPWDYVIVFTYRVAVSKVDASNKALEGAEFQLYKVDATDQSKVLVTVALSVEDNVFTGTGLDDGSYVLVETKAPDGYRAIDPVAFEVVAGHAEEWDYRSDAAGDAAFSPSGRSDILLGLSGEETTGVLEFATDEELSTLSCPVANTKEETPNTPKTPENPKTPKTTTPTKDKTQSQSTRTGSGKTPTTGDSTRGLPAAILATLGCVTLAVGTRRKRRRQ